MFVSQLKFRNAAFVVGFAILLVSSAWAGNSHSSKDLYFLAQKSYYQLKGSPDKQKFRHHWENVIQDFSKVVQRYPKSPQAYKAVFTMARLYEGLNGVSKNSKDLKKALHYYKKVSQDFSSGALTDDALFESAEIYRDIKDYSSATGIFKKIFEKYPNGDQANKARQQYQKLASIRPNTKTDQKVISSRPAKKQPPVLKQKKKSVPEAVKQAKATLPEKMKSVVLKQKKKSVIVKQAKLAPPASKKPVVLEKKKKSVVVKQAKLAPPAKKKPVKRTILGKGKRGYLYAPSSDKRERRALIVVDAGHGGKDQIGRASCRERV